MRINSARRAAARWIALRSPAPKARVFAAALNLTQSDAEFLRYELLRAAREVDASEGVADQYGQWYILDFELVRNDRGADVLYY
jgi:hypothetical protein